MPRFSLERSSYDGLSSFKSPVHKSPACVLLCRPAGLSALLGRGKDTDSVISDDFFSRFGIGNEYTIYENSPRYRLYNVFGSLNRSRY